MGWRPIANRLEAFASSRVEAIASRLEAIASRLEAMANGLEAIANRLEAFASCRAGLVGWRPLFDTIESPDIPTVTARGRSRTRLEARIDDGCSGVDWEDGGPTGLRGG